MKTVYFGAGLDIFPYTKFTELKDWISVDKNSSDKFVKDLTEKLYSINFTLENVVDEYKFYYKNRLTDQTIIYYINCKIPDFLPIINLYNCDTIYCSNYIPHINVLDYIGDYKLKFIGKYNNDYYREEEHENTLTYGINNLQHIRDRFNEFIYIDMNDVYVYDNWFKFLKKNHT